MLLVFNLLPIFFLLHLLLLFFLYLVSSFSSPSISLLFYLLPVLLFFSTAFFIFSATFPSSSYYFFTFSILISPSSSHSYTGIERHWHGETDRKEERYWRERGTGRQTKSYNIKKCPKYPIAAIAESRTFPIGNTQLKREIIYRRNGPAPKTSKHFYGI